MAKKYSQPVQQPEPSAQAPPQNQSQKRRGFSCVRVRIGCFAAVCFFFYLGLLCYGNNRISAPLSELVEYQRRLPQVAAETAIHVSDESHPSTTSSTSSHSVDYNKSNYFSSLVPLEYLMARMNLLTTHTGCSIATWSYNSPRHTKRELNDCRHHRGNEVLKQRELRPENVRQLLQPHDSIYVPFTKLEHFCKSALPFIRVDIVLISGQFSKVQRFPQHVFDTITEHPHITHWFMQNMPTYAYNTSHVKVHSFPYGLHWVKSPSIFAQEMIHNYSNPKDIFALVAFIDRRNNKRGRRNVPSIQHRLPLADYYERMHRSKYVPSPNGDRPECYRHYEAIGLGAMPLTELDPNLYRHFGNNVMYQQTEWDLVTLETTLPSDPVVNRRLVFEEYWMEYVENIVQHPLRWWDPTRAVRCSLAEIIHVVQATQLTGSNNVTHSLVPFTDET